MIKIFKNKKLKIWSTITIVPFLSSCFDFAVNVGGYQKTYGSFDLNRQDLISYNIATPIPYYDVVGQKYLRKHALTLVASDNNNNHYINAFVLNVFKSSDNQFQIPKPNNSNIHSGPSYNTIYNDVRLLIGTSFNQIKDLFPTSTNLKDLNDSSSNDKTVESKYKLRAGFMQFLDEAYLASSPNNNYKMYQLSDTEKNRYKTNHNLPENTYMDIESNSVKLIYTATNLSLNKNLFDFDNDINSQTAVDTLKNISVKNKSAVNEWIEAYDPSLNNPLIKLTSKGSSSTVLKSTNSNTEYKFAADFAVLELTIKKEEQNPYLKKLLDGFSSTNTENGISETYRQFRIHDSYQTSDFITGGFHYLEPKDALDEELRNAEPILTANANASGVLPSTITPENWSTYINIDNLGDDIEVDRIEDVSANDQKGVVSFELYLKNNKKNSQHKSIEIVQKTRKHPVVTGFKATSKQIYADNSDNKKPKKGTPITKWIEAYVLSGTYSDQSIYTMTHDLWNHKVYNKKSSSTTWSNVTDLSSKFSVIQHNDDVYLGIDSQVLVNDLDLNTGSAGSLVISRGWDNNKNNYKNLGIYQGVKKWHNFISGPRPLGVITLFTSPYRYDLIRESNNYSKPSLCDVLVKKSLKDKLVYPDITCEPSLASSNP